MVTVMNGMRGLFWLLVGFLVVLLLVSIPQVYAHEQGTSPDIVAGVLHPASIDERKSNCSAGVGFGIGSTDGAEIYEVACEKPLTGEADRNIKGFFIAFSSFEDEDVTATVEREVCTRDRYYRERCTTVTDTVVIDTDDTANKVIGAALCQDWQPWGDRYKAGGCAGGLYFLQNTADVSTGLGVYVEGRVQYGLNERYSVGASVFHGSKLNKDDKGITGIILSGRRWF